MKKLLKLLLFFVSSSQLTQGKTPKISPFGNGYDSPVTFPPDYCTNASNNEEWDFIVVGAGTGGTVVARRLAEDNYRVLLVEAGKDPPPQAFIPGKVATIMASNTWRFATIPDNTECLGMLFDSCLYNPGKCLGGGSVAYYMMYVRGNKKDYDEWEALGNTGWGYDSMLHYLKKIENYNASNYNPKYHGKGGPVLISDWHSDASTDLIRESMFKSAEELGFTRNYDNNGASQIGPVSLAGAVSTAGYRVTVTEAYLKNMPDNLKLCKTSKVSKVNLSMDKRATSVVFMHEDTTKFTMKAKKEVILSAGALMTPGILERSGIGKRDVLASAGIKMKHQLPGVGEHLQDHFVNMGCAFILDRPSVEPVNPMTIGLSSFTLFSNTTDINDPVPDIQYYLFVHEDVLSIGLNFKPKLAAQLSAANNETTMLLYFATAVLRPSNNGYVHVWNKDPNSNPLIVPNHFKTRYEAEQTIRGVRMARKLFTETKSMKRHNPRTFMMAECNQYKPDSDEEILCGAKHLANTVNHQCSTARMGKKDDPLAVVDDKLRVIGIKGLRIVDTSIFPVITRGNTWATTLAVGEKAADIIKAEYLQG